MNCVSMMMPDLVLLHGMRAFFLKSDLFPSFKGVTYVF